LERRGYKVSELRLIGMLEAARRLGISNTTMRRLVREGRLTVHENPLDKRQKLVDASEVDRLRVPLENSAEGKLAA
jgi:excisionase family DNA binding protein